MYHKEEVAQDLATVRSKLNKIPTQREYEKFGHYSLKAVIRHFGSWSKTVSTVFGINVQPRLPRVQHPCVNCSKTTRNPKFCSSTCSAIFLNKSTNGRAIGKRGVKTWCCLCGKQIAKHHKRCSNCQLTTIKVKNGYKKISEATKNDIATNDTQRNRRIRHQARRMAQKKGILKACIICGYSLHVDCAHKQSIESFDGDTLICVINDSRNLVGLCKNHHWEYDNGYLTLPSSIS